MMSIEYICINSVIKTTLPNQNHTWQIYAMNKIWFLRKWQQLHITLFFLFLYFVLWIQQKSITTLQHKNLHVPDIFSLYLIFWSLLPTID